MESSPYRKTSLLGIAHPVVGKSISDIGGTSGGEHIWGLAEKKAGLWHVHVFL